MNSENKIDIKEIQSIRFKWDRIANVNTVILVMGMLGFAAYMLVKLQGTGIGHIIGAVLIILITAILSIFTPLGLTVDDEYIVINKLLGRKIIRKEDIVAITSIDASIVRRSGRLAGSFGGFGYWGIYRSRKIGSFSLYATNMERLALIETTKKKYIINY